MHGPAKLACLLLVFPLAACGARSSLIIEAQADAQASSSGGGGSAQHPKPHASRTLSASWSHTCAITSDAKVACWGLPVGSPVIPNPVVVEGLDQIVEVAAGQVVDCARKADGTVLCWGATTGGKVQPIEGGSFSSIVAGSGAACGIDAASVACAGGSFLQGSACNMNMVVWNPTAEPVPLLDNILGVAIGDWHACAFDSAGVTSCWGCAGGPPPEGYWDLGSMVDSTLSPIVVPGASKTTLIASETDSTCAVQTDGSTICWGDRSQFGKGITVMPIGPTTADFPPYPIDIDVGVTFSCAGYANEVECFGGIPTFEDGCMDRKDDPVSFSIPDVAEISVGYEHACARDTHGAVWCWGCNGDGAVGDGTGSPRATPVQVL